MTQVKVTLKPDLLEFIDNYRQFGYKSRTQIINDAIELLQQKLEEEDLIKSAQIYQEIYETDIELQALLSLSIHDSAFL
jgi:metal-responsive CopG/Arc/MetJ family transcriptional regulator